MKRLVIELTDEQHKKIMDQFAHDNKVNAEEETFAGYSFCLCGTEWGITWLEAKVNTKIELDDVNWHWEDVQTSGPL